MFFIDSSSVGMLYLICFSDDFTVFQLSVSAYATCLMRQTRSTSAAHFPTVLLTSKSWDTNKYLKLGRMYIF